VKVLLTQNIQRVINKGDRCGKILLGLALCIHMCANVIRPCARDEEEIDEDEGKKHVLGDTLEELD
jgi:hypothetical protein